MRDMMFLKMCEQFQAGTNLKTAQNLNISSVFQDFKCHEWDFHFLDPFKSDTL